MTWALSFLPPHCPLSPYIPTLSPPDTLTSRRQFISGHIAYSSSIVRGPTNVSMAICDRGYVSRQCAGQRDRPQRPWGVNQ